MHKLSQKKMFVIKGGTVVTCDGVFPEMDLLVEDGVVSSMGKHLTADVVVDASGKLVMPGGIDPHVHLNYPQGPRQVVSSDDFYTGTAAAACGGTTCIVDFVERNGKEETMKEALDARKKDAGENSVIDFGLHMAVTIVEETTEKDIAVLVQKEGVLTFKIYMCYGIRISGSDILKALRAISSAGGMALVHAEDNDMLVDRLNVLIEDEKKKKFCASPIYHGFLHPSDAEVVAAHRVLAYGKMMNTKMHIVHVSAAGTVDVLKHSGSSNSGEVCIQHLVWTDNVYSSPDALKFIMAPPVRRKSDQDGLWDGIRDGVLSFVVTDHCPFTMAQRMGERRTPEFRRCPIDCSVEITEEEEGVKGEIPVYGMPGGTAGIEHRMGMLYKIGVRTGRLSLPQFVALTSTNAAKRFGMFPKKGSLMPGSDADIVIWDPELEHVISAKTMRTNCDSTSYEGMVLRGWPTDVFVRGSPVVRNGEFVGKKGSGQFIPRFLQDDDTKK